MRIAALVFALCSLVPPAWGQSVLQPTPGQRVWVRSVTPLGALGAGVKGTLEGLIADSVRIRPSNGSPTVSLPIGPRTRLFVFKGRRSSLGRGTAIGGGVGILAGALAGAAAGGDCSGGQFLCFDSGDLAAVGAIGGGLAGLVGGAIVGALSPRETWATPGWGGTVRPIVRPGARGVGFGFSTAF